MKTVSSIFNSPVQLMDERRGTNRNNDYDDGNDHEPRKYFSRKFSSRISWHELPLEKNAQGIYTTPGLFFLLMRLTVPLAHIYIFLILLRELTTTAFPNTLYPFLQSYTPPLAFIIDKMQKSSLFVEIWVFIEAIFYIMQILHIRYLQYKDPLEASLSAAPIATLSERSKLMNQILNQIVDDDPVAYIRGWFFDVALEDITRYDVMDFCTWAMFEGRNQEHLTKGEVEQLNWFVKELECRIGVFLYGEKDDEQDDIEKDGSDVDIVTENCTFINQKKNLLRQRRSINVHRSCNHEESDTHDDDSLLNNNLSLKALSSSPTSTKYNDIMLRQKHAIQPKQKFQFLETSHDATPGFFTNLFENYNTKYKQYQQYQKVQDGIQSIQSIRNYVANKRQQFVEAEEHAIAAASNMYESAYFKVVHKGSSFDKRVNAISNATQQQLHDAWNSVGKMKERLETAKYVSSRKKFLQQQSKGYHMLLERVIHSSSVPPRQLVDILNKITQCNESLEAVEDSAVDSFLKITDFARKHLLQQKEPCRYAKYSSDELIGLDVYPLAFNLAILGLTDGLLRIVMARRGFARLNIGTMIYYYHPGFKASPIQSDEDQDVEECLLTPIVFCHGIGIGLGYYLSLIDELLKLSRPIFLPEIANVCGFRPWTSRKSILTPPIVVSTLTAMLASHGHIKASLIGHSYGTSWLSYMCKYASHTVASLLFLDPICFCLHHAGLTKAFVYHRADPGSVSYIVKTDVIVNWTIQRAFPWSRIILFAEDIPNVPCSIYLSEHDCLIPIDIVEKYLKRKGAHFCDLEYTTSEHFEKGPINVTMLRGNGHGDWTLSEAASKGIVQTARILTEQYESKFLE